MSALSAIATWPLRYGKGDKLADGRDLISKLDAAGYVVTRKERDETGEGARDAKGKTTP